MRCLLILAASFLCASAQAAGIGLRAGTTGLGVDFGWALPYARRAAGLVRP